MLFRSPDTGCTTQSGGSANVVLDGRAQLYDLGATISGPNLTGPPYPTITAVSPGTSYTISGAGATAAASGLTMVIRFTNNIVITNNRFSQMFYQTSGQFGPLIDYDYNVPSNVWANNVYHDTGVSIPSH